MHSLPFDLGKSLPGGRIKNIKQRNEQDTLKWLIKCNGIINDTSKLVSGKSQRRHPNKTNYKEN